MDSEKPMKSAVELAMERLRKKDEEAGIDRRPLTDGQKGVIAELRKLYEAKVAELQVVRDERLHGSRDPMEYAEIEEAYRRERERLSTERDEKIEKIRQNPYL
jgi:hypothetical protein